MIKLKYPCLVPKRLCRTPVIVEIEQEGLNKYGEPNKSVVIKEMCNYQDSGQTILTAEKKAYTTFRYSSFHRRYSA